jgi:hypothetical protein
MGNILWFDQLVSGVLCFAFESLFCTLLIYI